jgi:hypothetical protein
MARFWRGVWALQRPDIEQRARAVAEQAGGFSPGFDATLTRREVVDDGDIERGVEDAGA